MLYGDHYAGDARTLGQVPMSDVLTLCEGFRPQPAPVSLRSTPLPHESPGKTQLWPWIAALTVSAGLIGPPRYAPASPFTGAAIRVAKPASEAESPAAFTESENRASLSEFSSALTEAIELSTAMVADGEASTLDFQTLSYAVQTLASVIVAFVLPRPLILPLQKGGLSVEWHEAGMNIELRFRKPYQVHAVIEDARGAVPSYHGPDSDLTKARAALETLSTRVTSQRDVALVRR